MSLNATAVTSSVANPVAPRGRILIVEDQPVIRESLARLLRLEGYDVTCAANGLEALVAVEAMTAAAALTADSPAHPDRPPVDLVLLDVVLPKMSGLQFLEELRRGGAPGWCRVPVMLLTGTHDYKQIARARDLGAADVMLKGKFQVDDLLARVRRQLGQRPAA